MPKIFSGPRIEFMPAQVFAGPVQRYDMQTRGEIPAQWDAYNAANLRAPSPSAEDYFALVFNFDAATGAFDYMCGQVLTPGAALPKGFQSLTVAAGNWARFGTGGHISTMNDAWGEVMGHWMAQPGCTPREGPSMEYYPPAFDGMTGEGGYEIWMPVA
jgi:AraC family transcriptional regulator